LVRRSNDAHATSTRRGTTQLLGKVEALAEQSLPVIAMSFAACDDILRPGKYCNYDQRKRDPAEAQHHADREMVGARLFPMYHQHILYAALSSDGRGLSSYGPVAVRWEVTANYLARRASLLEENSFTFMITMPSVAEVRQSRQGYRAIWDDRAKLVTAKLAPRLTSTTSESELSGMLLHAGTNREDDDFVEIYIYADGGIDVRNVNMVTLQQPPMTSAERHRRDLVQEVCAARGVAFVE
jgi:hypothetical protein